MNPERIGTSQFWKIDESGQAQWFPEDFGKYLSVRYRDVPKHYMNNKGVDVIDFCNIYSLNFNRGNIVKYICRAGKKDNELKDLEKALDYLQREIKFIKSK